LSRLTFLQSIQTRISDLLDKLESWKKTAWQASSREKHKDADETVHRKQVILETEYWSTKILLRLGNRIENQNDTSAKFDLDVAQTCVTAALEIVRLLPTQLDARSIYMTGPWWAIVHIS
jgi:hypothetical protein